MKPKFNRKIVRPTPPMSMSTMPSAMIFRGFQSLKPNSNLHFSVYASLKASE